MIYLTVHGETEWNSERRLQGRLDSPLTDVGRDQARLMGKTLRRLIGDPRGWTVISSPLGRAQTTARIISRVLGITAGQIELESRLAEVDLGSWAGLTREEIGARWAGVLEDATHRDWYFRSPDGETLEDVTKRMSDWLTASARRDRLIIVSHGIASRVLRGLYASMPMSVALALEVSREVVLRLSAGSVDRLPCN